MHDLADAGALRARVVAEPEPDVVLVEAGPTGLEGTELCAALVALRPEIPVLVVSDGAHYELAVAAIRAGAFDVLLRDLPLDALRIAVERAVAHRSLRREVRRLRREADHVPVDADIIGQSQSIQRLLRLLPKVASSSSSVLLTGESGTGKEILARAVHARSPRKDGPFVAINCAALPEALLESELFGHTRGAFTDARTARPGLFVRAQAGTLFLDEIGDLPLGMQAKLLRVLQERTIRPVGSDAEVAIDVRIVSATHRDLDKQAELGLFRSDLLYRLDVVRLELPPLREREEDITLLAERFLHDLARQTRRHISGFSPEAMRALRAWSWPGNVRELHNVVERALVLAEHDQITLDELPSRIARPILQDLAPAPKPEAPAQPSPSTLGLTLAEAERQHVLATLQAHGGQRTEAAAALGIDRKTLYRKLRDWGQA